MSEIERISITQDEQRQVRYAPGEPKSKITKCLLVATTTSAGVKADDITADVILVWTDKAVRHNFTLEEIEWAFGYVTDKSEFFPTWHRIFEAVRLHRSHAARIGTPPEPKSLPGPVTPQKRRELASRMDSLALGIIPEKKPEEPKKMQNVVVTDAERAKGKRLIDQLRGEA